VAKPLKIILGIESSCDETAVALVTDGREILAQRIASQDEEHRPMAAWCPKSRRVRMPKGWLRWSRRRWPMPVWA
jgi:hypothetical protein